MIADIFKKEEEISTLERGKWGRVTETNANEKNWEGSIGR